MARADQEPRAVGPLAGLARMPTGAKVFLFLLVFLLPFAAIALVTTLRTTQNAGSETRERLGVMAAEMAGMIENVLANQVAQLDQTLAELERNPADAPSCTRLAGTFAAQSGARFAVSDRRGTVLCGQRFAVAGGAVLEPGQVDATLVADGLTIRIGGNAGGTAFAFYPTAVLAALSRPTGFVPEYGATLIHGDEKLELRSLPSAGPFGRTERMRSAIGLDGLALESAIRGTPLTSPLIITTSLLILMLLAAAGMGWFVVDVLLIRPLRRLRRSVGLYQPGEVIEMKRLGPIPAQEIRELGETFRDISRTVQAHEGELAEGLVRQTKLTREVHHRVKNNLQVISSLINFHARGAKSAEAGEAYSSIQRRVDALAVVHRHHYAELEENRGLELRSVIGELAANMRATAPERAAGLGITLEIEPLLVNQDVAIAVAFLITELVELAFTCNPTAHIRISIKGSDEADRATLRVNSPALVESPALEGLLRSRYGRIIEGLARQLRTKLHHDPLVGAFEAGLAITGRP